jgi:hypothetical protein
LDQTHFLWVPEKAIPFNIKTDIRGVSGLLYQIFKILGGFYYFYRAMSYDETILI